VRKSWILLAILSFFVPVLFIGCGGSSGSTGSTGATGPAGPAGPGTNTNESCMICHTTGRIADIATYHPDPTAADVNITVTAVENFGGLPKVTVHLEDGSGNPITAALFDANRLSFYIADLVPADTPTNATLGTQSSPYFKRWASENLTTSGGVADNTDAANGNYVYTFKTPFSTLGTAGTDYADYSYTDNTHVQRLVVLWRGLDDSVYNRAGKTFDFDVPASGASAVELVSQRMFVTSATCKKCHGPTFQNAAHANSRPDTRICVVCHSPFYSAAMHDEGVQLSQFIHKIHAAIDVVAFPTRILGNGYVDVKFPQDVRNCTICHNNNSGEAVGAGDLTNNWKNHPNQLACISCHTGFPDTSHDPTDFKAQDGTTHPGGTTQPDTACTACHSATGHYASKLTGASVTEAHDIDPAAVLHPEAMNIPEFDVTLSLTPPAGAFYVAGDNVTVTVTLKDHATSTDVAGTVYTTAQGSAGVSGGGLGVASLYIYGPRALPKPIFAPTDNTQGHSLFSGTTDASGTVATDNTGFKYRFTVPSGLTNGTYMVRVRIGDYSRISDSNYIIESTAFQNIQIGTATVEKKVASTACVDCHGTVTAEFHDARHAVVFDTDQCISCHDYSGGFAAVLSNRVHAVHDANSFGDMKNPLGTTTSRDWSDVTYPSEIDTCVRCHKAGETSGTYKTKVGEVTCLGCHGDDPAVGGATNHMLQNGGDWPQ
jgi:Outer membrane cytochrome MtrC/MtrF-like, domains II/IV